MRSIETTGRNVEEAVQKALESLGIKKDNAEIEVLSEPSQGIFSFIGNKSARVSVGVRLEPDSYLKEYIHDLLNLMKIPGEVALDEDEEKYTVSIQGRKTAVLIGRHGKTLNELQYLLNTVMRRQFSGLKKMVILDVEGYRDRREQTLIQLAKSIARKVSAGGQPQTLEPMTPQERRIIHLALQESTEVVTYSKGEEPYRKVVIAPR